MSRDEQSDRLHHEANAARHLIEALHDDDEVLRHDMVEGETSFLEAIDAALAEIDECDVVMEGIAAKIAQFAERQDRAKRRIERLRGLIEQAMLTAGLPTVKRPTATLSVSEKKPAALIFDESLVPAQFWKARDPVLDKTAINAAVKGGETIPGVTLTNGGTTLTIRRK